MEYDTGAYAAITFIVLAASLVIFGTCWYQLHSVLNKSVKENSKNNDHTASDNEIKRDDAEHQQEQQQPSQKRNKETEPQFVLNRIAFECFALQRTLRSLTSTETKEGQVLCLNGIRVLSINWVILGHSYAYLTRSIGDQSYLLELVKRRGFTLVSNAYSSVDSFFALSGFLVSYLLLKQLTKRGHLTVKQWIAFYFHRYVRLTAPYLMMILLEGFLYRYMVSGPFSVDATTVTLHDTCKKDWWTNLLYINNLVPWNPTSASCLAQSWYLANDMQFFVIAPVFIVLLFYYPLAGNLVTLGAISCSAIVAAIITAHYNLAPSMALGNPQNYLKLYRAPWVRITPYLVGILGGWFYWCWGEQVKEKVRTIPEWKMVIIATPLWLATAAIEYEVIFGLYHDILANLVHREVASKADSVSYEMLARIGWSLALTIQILLCQCGLGGFINSLLSWKGWLVLSRLTYSVYLIHLGLIGLLMVQTRHAFSLEPDFEFAVYHLGVMVMSYLAAVVLYVTVEQPVALLETMTYRKRQ
jgi:peptidoglycan/LPS O-acetylase OafA/YrhL